MIAEAGASGEAVADVLPAGPWKGAVSESAAAVSVGNLGTSAAVGGFLDNLFGPSLAQVRRDNIEAAGKTWSAEEEAEFKQPIRDQFEAESNPYYATARLWDDGIIAPAETRRVLALCFSATLNAPIPETKFGVFRM